jgi:membrane-bound lytic murein transglycosylase F
MTGMWHGCLLLLLTGLLLGACNDPRFQKEPDELLVGILDDPVFYSPATVGRAESGFEYELLQAFAASQHKKLRVIPVSTPSRLRHLLDHGSIDFIAGLSVQDDPDLSFTTPIRSTQPLIVQNVDTLPIFVPSGLTGRVIEVQAGTPQHMALQQLQHEQEFTIEYARGVNGIDLLQRVSEFRSELAATDSLHLEMALLFYPDLVVAQELPGKVSYAWAFRKNDHALFWDADIFVLQALDNGTVTRLRDEHFGYFKRITPAGTMIFMNDIRKVLPRYRQMFIDAQAATGIDWRLLAALSYQESHWDPLAVSYTNVRGIMMLTDDTADYFHVTNRLDPAQGIMAGARNLNFLLNNLSAVPEPDRLWLALAGYNLGYGHLSGARQIAESMGRNPNSWYEMKQVLPLMSRPEYYQRLKAGPARGGEAVILVENVRIYYNILTRVEPPLTLPSLEADLKLP